MLSEQLSVAVTLKLTAPSSLHSKFASAGTPVITGSSVSVVVITCVATVSFPQSSDTVQVRVIVTPHPFVTICSSNAIGKSVSQLSVAVTFAEPASGISSHSTSISAGTPANSGAVVSVMIIVCVAVETFPQASVAVQVRIVVYD